MHFEKIHNKGQARLFKNDFLESLTKANPLVIWGMYIPILSFIIYTAATKYNYSTKTILLVFFGGMLFWTLFEYIAHRYIFHWVPKGPRSTKFVYTLHGNHHHYPRDKQRLFMPPVPSIINRNTPSVTFAPPYLSDTQPVSERDNAPTSGPRNAICSTLTSGNCVRVNNGNAAE